MKSYLSLSFLLFLLPLAILAYNLTPDKHRWKTLLLMNFCFFFYFSRKMTVFLILSIFSMHHFGLWLGEVAEEGKAVAAAAERSARKEIKKEYQQKMRRIMTGAALIHFGLLIGLKYSGFFLGNLNRVLQFVHLPMQLPVPQFMLPLGISFYTMMAASYLFDVYRGLIQPDRNIGRLALYLSFFPTIMEGPICRYQDTAEQLWKTEKVHYQGLASGSQRILWGLFKKVIIADRLNAMIQLIYDHYADYNGTVVAIGMIAYTIQLYMEFSGTMDAVIGVGEIFNIRLPENFRRPFFSRTISDFWARWHITLGTWFRDYIYYPLSMSGPMKKLTMRGRKKLGNYYGPMAASTVALAAVWSANGLWHGAAWNFLFFGFYHFFLLFTGKMLEPAARWISEKWHIDRESKGYRAMQIVRTTILVCIGEMFFRANGLRNGIAMFRQMITKFQPASLVDGTLLALKMDGKDFLITGLALLVVLAVSILQERGTDIRASLAAKPVAVRWTVFYLVILAVMIFGAYGMGYIGIDPIYAGF